MKVVTRRGAPIGGIALWLLLLCLPLFAWAQGAGEPARAAQSVGAEAAEGAAAAEGAGEAEAAEGAAVGEAAEGAQEAHPERRSFLFWVFFWSGGVVVMVLVGRVLFREHLHERTTLRMLRDHIGKVYPQFHPVSISHWVRRAGPHFWHARHQLDLESMQGFITPEFEASWRRRFERQRGEGRHTESRLGAILKVHTLGMYPLGDQPPPTDLELVLRVESRGVFCERGPDGGVLSGHAKERQYQEFWVLRHDGYRWFLHHIEPAESDRTDLAQKPPVPPLMAWRWPEDADPSAGAISEEEAAAG